MTFVVEAKRKSASDPETGGWAPGWHAGTKTFRSHEDAQDWIANSDLKKGASYRVRQLEGSAPVNKFWLWAAGLFGGALVLKKAYASSSILPSGGPAKEVIDVPGLAPNPYVEPNPYRAVKGKLILATTPKDGVSTDAVTQVLQKMSQSAFGGLAQASSMSKPIEYTRPASYVLIEAVWDVSVEPQNVAPMIAYAKTQLAPLALSTPSVAFSEAAAAA